MGLKDAKEGLGVIASVLSNPKLRPDQVDRMLRARRELLKAARSGKVDAQRIYLVVKIVSEVLLELVETKA